MIMNEGKQVGDLYYMVSNMITLQAIIEQEQIMPSSKAERNPYNGKKSSSYVCLSRSKDAALRNKSRWKYGLILDGTKLSDKYSIRPYSYTGSNNTKTIIKTLTEYDNNTYTVYIVNWGSIDIPKETYDDLRAIILNQSDEFNNSHKLMHKIGSKRQLGRLIINQYDYRVPHGGPIINIDKIPSLANIFRQRSYEAEERIWVDNGNTVNISGCIKGIYIPNNTEIQDSLNELIDSKNLDVKFY